jgi:hypothetical protein
MSSNQLELFTINYQEPEDGLVCIKCGIRKNEKQFYVAEYKHTERKEIKRTCYTCKNNQSKLVRQLKILYHTQTKIIVVLYVAEQYKRLESTDNPNYKHGCLTTVILLKHSEDGFAITVIQA